MTELIFIWSGFMAVKLAERTYIALH